MDELLYGCPAIDYFLSLPLGLFSPQSLESHSLPPPVKGTH